MDGWTDGRMDGRTDGSSKNLHIFPFIYNLLNASRTYELISGLRCCHIWFLFLTGKYAKCHERVIGNGDNDGTFEPIRRLYLVYYHNPRWPNGLVMVYHSRRMQIRILPEDKFFFPNWKL